MTTIVRVAKGQIWRSADRREDRRVRVLDVPADPPTAGARAVVEQVAGRGLPTPKGRRTRVQLDAKGRLARYQLEAER